MSIRVYTAKHCDPCHKIEDLIREGKISEDVELVDIETDEGFLKFKEEVLNGKDGAVPSAYKEGQQCKIGFDEEKNLVFECPDKGELPPYNASANEPEA